jgi:drug/metabolite transporter (DMT)-like permease
MTPEAIRQARTRLLAAFATVYVVWGSTYLAIAIAIQTLPPFLMAAGRFLVAGGVLYSWARWRGNPAPRPTQWVWALLFGVLFFLVGNGAVSWVEQWLPSGLTALIVAMVSVWTALLEWLRPGGARPTGMVLAGIVLGFLGVSLLVVPTSSGTGHADLFGVLLLMGSTLAWALGSVLSRTADLPESTVLVSGMEMLAGGALLFVASLVAGDWSRFALAAVSLKSFLAFLYLAIVGSLVTFTCFSWLLKVTSPSKVATAGYVNPMVAVFLGWAFGGEILTARSLLASLVIVASVVLIITGRDFAVRPRPATTATEGEVLARRDKVVT